jgi:hypothetical protein
MELQLLQYPKIHLIISLMLVASYDKLYFVSKIVEERKY